VAAVSVPLALRAVQQYRCSALTTGTMVSNGELVAYAASSVVGGVCTGATGFGKSILFHAVSLVVFAASGLGDPDLVQGVAILSVMSVCLFALVYSARADFNGALALLVMGPAALGVLCGTFVLVGSSQGLLKLVFGVRCTPVVHPVVVTLPCCALIPCHVFRRHASVFLRCGGGGGC